ncbi:UBX domain-containing protein 7 [Mactra antiquata]
MDKGKNDALVAQFCAVTGASKSIGKQLLEACGGNLELAVNMHMEGGGASSTDASCTSEDDVRAPIPQTQEILVDDGPAYGPLRNRKRKARSVFDGFRDFQEEARQQEEELRAGTSGSLTSRKSRTLQDLFRPPIDMTYKGTLASAREAGKSQSKWLMINIQNVQEFACQALNRDVWSKDVVKALVKDNFIFWQVYHDSEEGQKYCHFYKVDDWPYIAILDPRTGENLIVWHKVEALTFCDLVSEFLSQHSSLESLTSIEQPAKRLKTEDSLMDATEDDQLQAAITASLTETTKPVCVVKDSDSDDSELETFTDSDDDVECLSDKIKQHSGANNKIQVSPSSKHSCKDKQKGKQSPERQRKQSPTLRNHRCRSPLAGTSASVNSVPKSDRKTSPRRNTGRQTTPDRETKRKISPKRKMSPNKHPVNSSPEKSKSIHNDVHPAVLENIRRNSTSEDDDFNDSSVTKDSKTSVSDISVTTSANLSSDTFYDTRDYETYLGPDTDEKTTLMLRLPDGQREKLCVAFSSKLMAIVLFVASHGYSNERYELIAQFPRRMLSQLDFDATLRDIGLHAQETIFVQAR